MPAIPVYLGQSDDDGFEISIKENKKAHSWSIREGKLGPHEISGYINPNIIVILWCAALFSFSGVVAFLAAIGSNNLHSFLDYFGWTFLSTCIGLIIATFAIGLLVKKSLREYHAAEHAIYAMLRTGLEPTVENFKKSPKLVMSCGSSQFVSSLIILIAIAWGMIAGNVTIILSLAGLMFFFWGLDIIFWMVSRPSRWPVIGIFFGFIKAIFYYTRFWLFGVVSLIFVIPPLLEYTMMLRRPSPERTQEALRLARHIKEQYESIKSAV